MTSLTSQIADPNLCDCARADWLTCQCHRYQMSAVNAWLTHGNCHCRCHRDENDQQVAADKWRPVSPNARPRNRAPERRDQRMSLAFIASPTMEKRGRKR